MKKILLVLPRFNRQKYDALTDQAWNIARRLTAGAYAQCVIAAVRDKEESAMEAVFNVPIYRFSPECQTCRWLRRKCTSSDIDSGNLILPGLELFLQKKQFDLIHIFGSGRLCRQTLETARKRNIPCVVSCRSEDFDLTDPYSAGGSAERLHNFQRRCREYGDVLKESSRILCSDHGLRRLLAERLGDRLLTHWLPGVDYEYFSKLSLVDFRQFYQIPQSRMIILSVGRMCEEHNQKLLLDMIGILNTRGWNCQLMVIGWEASTKYAGEFKKLVRERKMSGFVTCIPGLPPGDERFRAAFQAASLVMLPSLSDVSGPAVLEAWASGVPVIASPMGSGGELIDDGISGKLVMPFEFQSWVNCCEELLNERNRAVLEKMRSSGMAKARTLRWENRLEELKKIYDGILNV